MGGGGGRALGGSAVSQRSGKPRPVRPGSPRLFRAHRGPRCRSIMSGLVRQEVRAAALRRIARAGRAVMSECVGWAGPGQTLLWVVTV